MNYRALVVVAAALGPSVSAQPGPESKRERTEYRIGAVMLSSKSTVALAGTTGMENGTGSQNGVMLLVRDAGAGITGRYITGSLGNGSLLSGDSRLIEGAVMLGTRGTSLHLGYSQRDLQFNGEERSFRMPRVGLTSGYYARGAGVGVDVGGFFSRTIEKQKTDSAETDNLTGEVSMFYVPPAFPFYAQIGYRRDVFSISRPGTQDRLEESSAVFFSVGLQAGLTWK